MSESNPYAPPPVPQQSYQPVTKKPPLTPRLKRAASVAGAVSFTVMSIGWGLLATALGIGLFAGFSAAVLGLVDASGEGRDADYRRMMDFIDTINPAAWIVPLVIAGLVGLGLWVGSLFISRGMLARAKHPSPWGVTWAGAGIAIVASWFVSWIAWLPLQIAGAFSPGDYDSFDFGFGTAIAFGIVGILLNLAITAVVGWLAWWWMAHVMRPVSAPA